MLPDSLGGRHPHRRPSKVDDARAGMTWLLPAAVGAPERKYASSRLCISASVLGAGVHGIALNAVVDGVSGVSSGDDGVWGVWGVGGSEGRSEAPEKVSRPSAGSYMATKVSAVWGGTSSDQRCWVPESTTVLEEVVSLGAEDACDVLIVSDGGVCRWVGISKSPLKNEYEKTRRYSFGPGSTGVSIRAAWHSGLLG